MSGMIGAAWTSTGRWAKRSPPAGARTWITPEQWVDVWTPELASLLDRGFDAAWWARFPIGPGERAVQREAGGDDDGALLRADGLTRRIRLVYAYG